MRSMCYKLFAFCLLQVLFIVDTSELTRTLDVQYGPCHIEYLIIAEFRSDNPSLHSSFLIIRVLVFKCVNRSTIG